MANKISCHRNGGREKGEQNYFCQYLCNRIIPITMGTILFACLYQHMSFSFFFIILKAKGNFFYLFFPYFLSLSYFVFSFAAFCVCTYLRIDGSEGMKRKNFEYFIFLGCLKYADLTVFVILKCM